MFALIKRVLDLAGSFSPAARRSLTWGMVCNILKAFFMAGMLGAVFWALENRDHLDAVVALQCLGILAVSVIGQYVFQYLVDITMDAQGFHIFRDLRPVSYTHLDVYKRQVSQYTELPWILLMLAMFAAGTALGAVIGAKFLKKHVRKAKIA